MAPASSRDSRRDECQLPGPLASPHNESAMGSYSQWRGSPPANPRPFGPSDQLRHGEGPRAPRQSDGSLRQAPGANLRPAGDADDQVSTTMLDQVQRQIIEFEIELMIAEHAVQRWPG